MLLAMPEETKAPEDKKPEPSKMVEEEPIVTEHSLALKKGKLEYTATTGRMPIKNEDGEIDAQIFYVAYTKKNPEPNRPLMFSFNGGPGSPAVWLHLGALGPKRVRMSDDGKLPAPPYSVEANPQTWLEHTDLVFIDPIGTGFSRARNKEIAEKAWGLKGDIESVAEFIRMFLVRNERWNSPLYLVGESYGTTRSAGLSQYLLERGIAFNGIVLVSSILNFQTARFNKGNDLPYPLFLPTYTATAWYHGSLSKERQKDLQATLREAEAFCRTEYPAALGLGDAISPEQKRKIAKKISDLTGLSAEYVERRDLRIHIQGFCKELLRKDRRTVGRLDSRYKGIDLNQVAETPEHDPSMSALMPPYTSAFHHYVRTELEYKSDLEYAIFGGIKKPWEWGSAGEGHPDTSEALRVAMSKNPHMRVMIASGYYDLATPYFATEYTLAHMGLDPEVRQNILTHEYEAGHMMYIHEPSLEKLKGDIATFLS